MSSRHHLNAGIGLRAEHYDAVLEQQPRVGWMEVHSENYFGAGGKPRGYLDRIRRDYPISLHGVGLSLGSTDELNRAHLTKLRDLMHRCEPLLVSEHLSWSSVDGRYFNDLLPLPYTEEAMDHIVSRIMQTQDFLGRQILIENLSSYVTFTHSTLAEWDFLTETARRSGCGILLDINNIYVSSVNHGFDPLRYLDAVPAELVGEMHLAGHTRKTVDDGMLIIDSHDQPVADDVWSLFAVAAPKFAHAPVLIEWDSSLPPLQDLVAEATRAQHIREARDAIPA